MNRCHFTLYHIVHDIPPQYTTPRCVSPHHTLHYIHAPLHPIPHHTTSCNTPRHHSTTIKFPSHTSLHSTAPFHAATCPGCHTNSCTPRQQTPYRTATCPPTPPNALPHGLKLLLHNPPSFSSMPNSSVANTHDLTVSQNCHRVSVFARLIQAISGSFNLIDYAFYGGNHRLQSERRFRIHSQPIAAHIKSAYSLLSKRKILRQTVFF